MMDECIGGRALNARMVGAFRSSDFKGNNRFKVDFVGLTIHGG